MITELTTTFDYTQLDEDTRSFLLEKEAEMELVLRRTAHELGTILLEIKARLPHGYYTPWLASKGISQQTAHRWMQIAQGKLPLKSPKMSDLPRIAEPEPEVSTDWNDYFPFGIAHDIEPPCVVKEFDGELYLLPIDYFLLCVSLIGTFERMWEGDKPVTEEMRRNDPTFKALCRELTMLQRLRQKA